MAAFLVVILAAAITFDAMLSGVWQASLRTEIERNLVQKTQLLAHRVETDRTGRSLADIAAQEGQAAGARVTIIDSSGNVLADSEANPAATENHATRPEFVAALSGRIGSNERRSATRSIGTSSVNRASAESSKRPSALHPPKGSKKSFF